MSVAGHPRRGTVSMLRRVIVWIIIVSFGLAAIGGIVVLVGVPLGDEAGRVLGTTAVVGAFSVAVLCCAALIGRRLQAFGVVGAIVSVASAVLVIALIWYRGDGGGGLWDAFLRLNWTGVAASAAFALAALLLLLADRRQEAVRIGLIATLALFAVVLAMTIYAIWWSDTVSGDAYARVLGVFAILAALGAVVLPVMSLLLRDRAVSGLSEASLALLRAEAARRGVTVDALVDSLLGSPADGAATPGQRA